MARRMPSEADQGPAVPRWVVEFDPARWGDSDSAYGKWQWAAIDWADANLHAEDFGAWMDVCSQALRMRGQ
jgi:hypothetical protein